MRRRKALLQARGALRKVNGAAELARQARVEAGGLVGRSNNVQ